MLSPLQAGEFSRSLTPLLANGLSPAPFGYNRLLDLRDKTIIWGAAINGLQRVGGWKISRFCESGEINTPGVDRDMQGHIPIRRSSEIRRVKKRRAGRIEFAHKCINDTAAAEKRLRGIHSRKICRVCRTDDIHIACVI